MPIKLENNRIAELLLKHSELIRDIECFVLDHDDIPDSAETADSFPAFSKLKIAMSDLRDKSEYMDQDLEQTICDDVREISVQELKQNLREIFRIWPDCQIDDVNELLADMGLQPIAKNRNVHIRRATEQSNLRIIFPSEYNNG